MIRLVFYPIAETMPCSEVRHADHLCYKQTGAKNVVLELRVGGYPQGRHVASLVTLSVTITLKQLPHRDQPNRRIALILFVLKFWMILFCLIEFSDIKL